MPFLAQLTNIELQSDWVLIVRIVLVLLIFQFKIFIYLTGVHNGAIAIIVLS